MNTNQSLRFRLMLLILSLGVLPLTSYGQTAWLTNGNTLSSTGKLGSANAYDLHLITGNSPWLAIKTTGLVGIGTTSPSFNLDVSGTGRFTSNLRIGAYPLPSIDGVNGQVLKTDGAGVLTWSNDHNILYTAGTGINIAGNVISNTAPDQLVSLNSGSGISVSEWHIRKRQLSQFYHSLYC